MDKEEQDMLESLIIDLDGFVGDFIGVGIQLLKKNTVTAEEQQVLDIVDEVSDWYRDTNSSFGGYKARCKDQQ